ADYGLTWTSLDAPLVEIGAVTDETPRRSERRIWLQRLAPSTRLFSYVMNNYWHTNYKADQAGPVTLRYVLAPHNGSDTATAKKLGLEAASPLVPVAADPASPVPRFPLNVLSEAFVATRLKPSTDGTARILRLFNASSGPEKLALSGEAFEAGRVFLSDLNENQGPRLSSPLEVPAFGILTLLIR
ncbi:MAG: glycosyl hydrolase-related protein, partial [Candidatus Aminicenantales bacterium]